MCIPLLADPSSEVVSALLLAASSIGTHAAVWNTWQTYAASSTCHVIGSMLFQTSVDQLTCTAALTDALLLATVAAPYCVALGKPAMTSAAQRCGLLPRRLSRHVDYVLSRGLVVADPASALRPVAAYRAASISTEEDDHVNSSNASDAEESVPAVGPAAAGALPAPTIPLQTLLEAVAQLDAAPDILQGLGSMRVELLEALLVQLGLQHLHDAAGGCRDNEEALAWATQRVMGLLQCVPGRRAPRPKQDALACRLDVGGLPRRREDDGEGRSSLYVVPAVAAGHVHREGVQGGRVQGGGGGEEASGSQDQAAQVAAQVAAEEAAKIAAALDAQQLERCPKTMVYSLPSVEESFVQWRYCSSHAVRAFCLLLALLALSSIFVVAFIVNFRCCTCYFGLLTHALLIAMYTTVHSFTRCCCSW